MGIMPRQVPRSLRDHVIAFCHVLRGAGFRVGIQETLDALRIAEEGGQTLAVSMQGITAPRFYRQGLRTMVCTSRDEWRRFDDLFDQFWYGIPLNVVAPRKKQARAAAKEKAVPLLMIGSSLSQEATDEGSRTTGAHAVERLKKTDFSEIPEPDKKRLEALVLRLCRQMELNLSRRVKLSRQKKHVDLRRTIRASLEQGGTPLRVAYKARKEKKNRLVALIDVSGSMDSYSYFMLLFIYAMQPHFEETNTFLFSTRLACVDDALKKKKFKDVMAVAGELTDAWSSGTRIGETFQVFVESYGRQLLRRDTLVFILSDGLDTGEPGLLAHALSHIQQRVKRVVWLNPLKGMKEYEPLASGMKSALPYIDVFASAHNLESLLRLEKTFRHV